MTYNNITEPEDVGMSLQKWILILCGTISWSGKYPFDEWVKIKHKKKTKCPREKESFTHLPEDHRED